MPEANEKLRALPSVDRVLGTAGAIALLMRYPRSFVVEAVRRRLDGARIELADGTRDEPPTPEEIVDGAAQSLHEDSAPKLRAVVNATGVVLHTNLGRALLADEAVDAVASAAANPTNLEYDLDLGGRGERDGLVVDDLRVLTGAEDATVVNNNAAAVLLALNTLAEGREVVVSRGELIEIGGSFRIPDVMQKSGAILREVGTTNRTHAGDYASAINERTALLLKVHTSNYRIVGFTSDVSLEALVAIARQNAVPVMEDLGSGALIDLSEYGLPKEPVVAERLAAGADLVTFSGDKLLGGPQCGIIAGRRELIERIRKNPLKRALRCDKLTLAALAATLKLYRSAPVLEQRLPTLRWLTRPMHEITRVGALAVRLLQTALGESYAVELIDSAAEIGSGALPIESLPSKALSITHPEIGPNAIAARFRRADPPIIGRIHNDCFLLDLRGIFDANDLVPRS